MTAHATSTVLLRTPPLPLLVDRTVFDGFNWARSRWLEWRRLGPMQDRPLSEDPSDMAFVFRSPSGVRGVPAELARLHVGRAYGLNDERCIAPYAIDDATDELFSQRIEPHSALWLATNNLDGLFWGLHDWAHFHSHGSFEERTANELQCDLSALCWLWLNRQSAGVSRERFARLRMEVLEAHQRRCAADPPRVAIDDRPLREDATLCALAQSLVEGVTDDTEPTH